MFAPRSWPVLVAFAFRLGLSLSLAAGLAACGADAGSKVAHDSGRDAGQDNGNDGRETGTAMPAPSSMDAGEAGARGDTAAEALAVDPPDPGPPVAALPAGVMPARRIFGPEVILTGDDASSCARGTSSRAGQLWCGFSLPAGGQALDKTTLDLWVLDIVAAAAGTTPVPCDGSHPACRKIHEKIWTGMPLGGPSHPFSHAFDGDTLVIYGDAPSSATALHQGSIFAWRPGFARARPISSDRGLLCRGHATAAVAYCLDDVAGNPERPDSVEVRAGALDEAGTTPLPSFGRFRPHRADGASDWQAEFSADGKLFLFSSPDPDPAVPILRWIATDQVGRGVPQEVVRDVGPWRIGSDVKRLYYMTRMPNGGASALSWMVPPGPSVAPGPATRIADGARRFDLLDPAGMPGMPGIADRGITFHSDGPAGRGFQILQDPTAPQTAQKLFSYPQTPEAVQVAPDLRHTVWISYDFVGELVRHDDLSRCPLATSPLSEVFNAGFLGAQLVYWSEGAGKDQERNDGFIAPRDNCRAAVRFAKGLHRAQVIKDRGVVFTDSFDDRAETVTLKFARLVEAGAVPGLPARLGRAVIIAEKVHQYVTVVGDGPTYVMFRATAASSMPAGVYLFGPLPFAEAPTDP